jgi:hypothetical protein
MKSAFVLRLPDGRGLIDMLAEGAGEVRGWVQGSGFVEEVELRVAGDGIDPRRTLRGRFTLVSLSGPVGGPYAVQLARASGGGFELAAGELVSARTAGVHALLIPAQVLGEEPDFSEAAPPAAQPAAPGIAAKPSTWAAQAAAVASAAAEDDDEEEQAQPERGDLVHHFAFGWCEVIMVNGERLKLRDQKGPGRIREIIIDVLDVAGPSEKDGKRAFKLTRRQ